MFNRRLFTLKIVVAVIFAPIIVSEMINEIFSTDERPVKFKTQLPPEDSKTEKEKDCSEYLFGTLNAIRKHGTTWRNGNADCSNCTCDNGDIRCFFHFCNEPPAGFITPPFNGENSSDENERDNDFNSESSGDGPLLALLEDSQGPIRPENDKEKWKTNLISQEVSSTSLSPSNTRVVFSKDLQQGRESVISADRNGTDIYDSKAFCSPEMCKSQCLNGIMLITMDLDHSCLRCICNPCPTNSCKKTCTYGYISMENGCPACNCLPPPTSSDNDIVFTDESDGMMIEDELSSLKKNQSSIIPLDTISQEENTNNSTTISSILSSLSHRGKYDNRVHSSVESLNFIQIHGCFDGSDRYPVGSNWNRGPCISCLCVTSGYSECNITQCPTVWNCPEKFRFTPKGSCCEICKDINHVWLSVLEDNISKDTGEISGEKSSSNNNTLLVCGGSNKYLWYSTPAYISLIPLGVLFSLAILTCVYLWTRSHRNKYKITTSYEPDERQKLRPGRLLIEDNSPI